MKRTPAPPPSPRLYRTIFRPAEGPGFLVVASLHDGYLMVRRMTLRGWQRRAISFDEVDHVMSLAESVRPNFRIRLLNGERVRLQLERGGALWKAAIEGGMPACRRTGALLSPAMPVRPALYLETDAATPEATGIA